MRPVALAIARTPSPRTFRTFRSATEKSNETRRGVHADRGAGGHHGIVAHRGGHSRHSDERLSYYRGGELDGGHAAKFTCRPQLHGSGFYPDRRRHPAGRDYDPQLGRNLGAESAGPRHAGGEFRHVQYHLDGAAGTHHWLPLGAKYSY